MVQNVCSRMLKEHVYYKSVVEIKQKEFNDKVCNFLTKFIIMIIFITNLISILYLLSDTKMCYMRTFYKSNTINDYIKCICTNSSLPNLQQGIVHNK